MALRRLAKQEPVSVVLTALDVAQLIMVMEDDMRLLPDDASRLVRKLRDAVEAKRKEGA